MPQGGVGVPHICTNYYPMAALPAEGTTQVLFLIGVDGHTKDVKVVVPSGSQLLDDAAIACVGQWEFKPATQDGNPVEVTWSTLVNWHPPME